MKPLPVVVEQTEDDEAFDEIATLEEDLDMLVNMTSNLLRITGRDDDDDDESGTNSSDAILVGGSSSSSNIL